MADSSVSALEGSSDRGPRRSSALLIVAAIAALVLLIAAGPAAAAAPSNYLSAVQCPSATSCFAVGDYGSLTLDYNSLAEHWNGAAWAIQASPSWQSTGDGIYANGLSCPSKIVCWAVGGYVTPGDVSAAFAMRWNGQAWRLGDPPDPSGANNSFESMYCLTTLYCLAAGYYANNGGVSTPLIDAYTVTPKVGVRWAVLTVPAPAGANATKLAGISCDGTTNCDAVGDYQNSKGVYLPLAEHSDGRSSWKLAPAANPTGSIATYLTGLTCTSTTSCMAVGYYENSSLLYRTLVEKWNGARWALVSPASGGVSGFLYSIACSGTNSCIAVGQGSSSKGDVALAERWNGFRLSVLRIPSPGTNGELTGVACTSAASCTAVGYDTGGAGVPVTLAEHWNGSAWSVHRTPNG